MLVGGTIGAIMVIAIFAMVFVFPPVSMTSTSITTEVEEKETGYSKNLSLIEIFEKAEPSVVRVNVQRTEESIGGVGSGFVFDKKGHIITNAHVVKDAKKVVVTFLDGRSYNAKIIGIDEYTDIAVVKVNTDLSSLEPVSLGDSSSL